MRINKSTLDKAIKLCKDYLASDSFSNSSHFDKFYDICMKLEKESIDSYDRKLDNRYGILASNFFDILSICGRFESDNDTIYKLFELLKITISGK